MEYSLGMVGVRECCDRHTEDESVPQELLNSENYTFLGALITI